MQRKRELDSTKEKLDNLIDRLYVGREIGVELRGAIDNSIQQHVYQRQQDKHDYFSVGIIPEQPPLGMNPL